MIVYICSEEHRENVQRMAELHEWDLVTHVGACSLSDYMSGHLQVINHMSHLVVDRSEITETTEELSDVIETIQSMDDVEIVILENELEDEGGQRNVLYRERYTSLRLSDSHVWKNLEYLLTGQTIPAEREIDGIWIGVMSANSGAGTTAFSIGLTGYIHRYDTKVCYVEANESGDLAAMADAYGMERLEDNHYKKEDIEYWHQSIDQTQKYVVIDLGKYSAAKLKILEQCSMKILISDCKPYRMADLKSVYRYMNDRNTRVCLNFGNSEMYEKRKTDDLQQMNYVYGLASHCDLFDTRDPVYAILMREYLNTNSQSGLTFLIRPDRWKELLSGRRKAATPEALTKPEPEETAVEATDSEEVTEETETPAPAETIQTPEETTTETIQQDDEQEIEPLPEKPASRRIKKKTVVSMLALLLAGVGMYGIYKGVPVLQERFSFTIPDEDSETTSAAIDEDLNINPDIKISVLEVDGADGYEVSYSTDKEFPAERTVVVEVETADKAVESLVAGKTYYVRVRAFKVQEDGTKVYGAYTDVQKIET